MREVRIGVKFCGNCNPRIKGRSLLEKIKGQMPEAVWLPADSPEKQVLLIISGCTTDCATRPVWSGPIVSVAGETVDNYDYPNAVLAEVVITKLEVIRNELAGNI